MQQLTLAGTRYSGRSRPAWELALGSGSELHRTDMRLALLLFPTDNEWSFVLPKKTLTGEQKSTAFNGKTTSIYFWNICHPGSNWWMVGTRVRSAMRRSRVHVSCTGLLHKVTDILNNEERIKGDTGQVDCLALTLLSVASL